MPSLLSVNVVDIFGSGLIGGVLALKSFQEYFGLDQKSAAARADLSGNIVSVLQAGCLYVTRCPRQAGIQ